MSASGISINPAVYAKLPYDAVNDFVASPARFVSADHDRQRIVADQIGGRAGGLRQANPDKMNYASFFASFQLVTELFKQKTGAPMQVILLQERQRSPYWRSFQAGDHDHRRMPVRSPARSRAGPHAHWRSPRPKRMEDLPDVPTLKEAGVDVDAGIVERHFCAEGNTAGDCPEDRSELMRDRQASRRGCTSQNARHRHHRQFVGRVYQDPGG